MIAAANWCWLFVISVLAVILHPAWPCPFYTPAELAERPRRFRNSQYFYPPAVRLRPKFVVLIESAYIKSCIK